MALRVKADIASVRISPVGKPAQARYAVEYEIESSVDTGPLKRDSFLLDPAVENITGATTLNDLNTKIIAAIKAREGIA